MANVTLTNLVATNPVTAALTGEEPLETVVSGVSEGARLRQLSFAAIKPQVVIEYYLTLDDQGKVVTMDSAAANTLRVPTNATVPFPIGATVIVRQIGGGSTTIGPAAGVGITKRASLTLELAEKWAQIVLHKIDTDTWHTTGEYVSL